MVETAMTAAAGIIETEESFVSFQFYFLFDLHFAIRVNVVEIGPHTDYKLLF